MNSQQQPKRKLQGPRPATLKICSDSQNIRKPQSMAYSRPPVIVYLRSPEVIHTEPREFMTLVQRLTGRVNAHDDSSSASSSFQSPVPNISHTSVPGNPNGGRAHASPTPPRGGRDFVAKEDKWIVGADSNHSDFAKNVGSDYSSVESMLSPSMQYIGSMSPLSPNFFLPSPRGLLSLNIFHEFPLHTPHPDFLYNSPTYMLGIQSEPIFTPPAHTAAMNAGTTGTATLGWHSNCDLKA